MFSLKKKYFSFFNISGFTLVELIVVITILAILWTIAFLSFSGYSGSARDSVRVSDMKSLSKWLEVFATKAGSYPLPENITWTGKIGSIEVAYLGNVQSRNASNVGISKSPIDPLTNSYYSYGVTWNQRYYQIAGTLEDGSNLSYSKEIFIDTVYAASNNVARIEGNYNWLLIFNSWSELWAANIPSLIYGFSGSNVWVSNLIDSAGTVFVTNKNTNLPYSSTATTVNGAKLWNVVLQELTGSSSLILAATKLPTDIPTYNIQSSAISSTLWYSVSSVWQVAYGKKYLTDASTIAAAATTFSLSVSSIGLGWTVTISDNCPVHPTSYTSSVGWIVTILGNQITAQNNGTTTISPVWGDCGNITMKTLTVIPVVFTCWISTVSGRSPDTTIYQTVLGADGRCWLASNLGTANIATSSTDSSAYGWLYQWGRGTDGHQIPTSSTTTSQSIGDIPGHDKFIYSSSDWRSIQNDALSTTWGVVNGINSPCPIDWKIPTPLEWSTEKTAASMTNSTTAFSSSLRLTLAGFRSNQSALLSQGLTQGFYLTSAVSGIYSNTMYFDASSANTGAGMNRASGIPVRCIKN